MFRLLQKTFFLFNIKWDINFVIMRAHIELPVVKKFLGVTYTNAKALRVHAYIFLFINNGVFSTLAIAVDFAVTEEFL